MEELKNFRLENSLTQDQLGAYLGMKKSFISKIETGREKFPLDKFQKLMQNEEGWNTRALQEVFDNLKDSSRKPTRRLDLFNARANSGQFYGWVSGEEIRMLQKSSGEIKNDRLYEENQRLKKEIEDLKKRLDESEKQRSEFWDMIKKLTEK